MNLTEVPHSELCEERSLEDLLQDYVAQCSSFSSEDDTKNANESSDTECRNRKKASATISRPKTVFPNLAGFCRYLGIATEELEEMASKQPRTYERILTVLEDEALNSGLSATLLSAYLKKRLGYEAPTRNSTASSQLQICFEHDILEDGE